MLNTDMKERYRVVQLGARGGTFYCKDNETGARTSLKTKNRKEAERLVQHKNEALKNPHVNRKIGMAYLSAVDPKLVTRTWSDVMDDIVLDKEGATLRRWKSAIKDPALHFLKDKVVVVTLAEDFLAVLRAGTVSTNVYLRRLQNHCLDLGWLPVPVLPKKKFPKIKHKEKRGITAAEHQRIIAAETAAARRNQGSRNSDHPHYDERRDFYELCWYLGGSQSDIAHLDAADIDYKRHAFAYSRKKTSNLGGMRIGPKAWEVIMRRPRTGPLFPYLITVREADRATEFKQRCDGLGIKDVSLHCYRYGWAERSAEAGYPERYAQRVLGQNSKAVHRAYAKKARKQLPSLEEYEAASQKAEAEGKILVIAHEAEVPKAA
jgi:integrase